MHKIEVPYVDFNGDQRVDTLYFNLTKAEFMEQQLRHNGKWQDQMQRIIDSNDGATIIDEFKRIIFSAYGEKSEDGRYFRKSEEISQAFADSAAYDVFFMSIVTDADAAAKFVNALVPQDLASAVAESKIAQPQDHLAAQKAVVEQSAIVHEPELPAEPAPARFDPQTGQPLSGI